MRKAAAPSTLRMQRTSTVPSALDASSTSQIRQTKMELPSKTSQSWPGAQGTTRPPVCTSTTSSACSLGLMKSSNVLSAALPCLDPSSTMVLHSASTVKMKKRKAENRQGKMARHRPATMRKLLFQPLIPVLKQAQASWCRPAWQLISQTRGTITAFQTLSNREASQRCPYLY